MKAEETLQYMADFYPTVFPTRKKALEHLFCVGGNGYYWENGELVSEDTRMSRYNLKEKVIKARFKYGDDYIDPSVEYKKLLPNFNEELYKPFLWIRRYSRESNKDLYLYNYPEDIKDDWKALIEECKDHIRKEGLDPD